MSLLGEGGHLSSPLAFAGRVGRASGVHDVRLERSTCPHVFCLQDCSPPRPSARESWLFVGPLSVCSHRRFWLAGFLLTQSGISEAKKDTQKPTGPHHLVISGVLRSLASALLSPLFRVYLYFFYVKCPGILAVLGRRNNRKHTCSIFPEWKSSLLDFKNWHHSPSWDLHASWCGACLGHAVSPKVTMLTQH